MGTRRFVPGERRARGLDAARLRAIIRAGRGLEIVLRVGYDRDRTLAHEVSAPCRPACATRDRLRALRVRPGRAEPTGVRPTDGAKPRLATVFPLGRLAATRAYQAMAMGVVARPRAAGGTLADTQGVRVGAVAGTMAGSALVLYRNGSCRRGW
jgi:hypothetical protein